MKQKDGGRSAEAINAEEIPSPARQTRVLCSSEKWAVEITNFGRNREIKKNDTFNNFMKEGSTKVTTRKKILFRILEAACMTERSDGVLDARIQDGEVIMGLFKGFLGQSTVKAASEVFQSLRRGLLHS